jgi:hypothetical protein
MFRLVIMAALLIVAAPAKAQNERADAFERGNNFVRFCEGSIRNKIECMAYLLGVFHGSQFGGATKTVCLPEGVDTGQLYEVAMAYIRNNPARAHWAPFGLMLLSWKEAFPCEPWKKYQPK